MSEKEIKREHVLELTEFAPIPEFFCNTREFQEQIANEIIWAFGIEFVPEQTLEEAAQQRYKLENQQKWGKLK